MLLDFVWIEKYSILKTLKNNIKAYHWLIRNNYWKTKFCKKTFKKIMAIQAISHIDILVHKEEPKHCIYLYEVLISKLRLIHTSHLLHKSIISATIGNAISSCKLLRKRFVCYPMNQMHIDMSFLLFNNNLRRRIKHY